MPRLVTALQALVLCTVVWFPPVLEASQPFDLPECAADFDTEIAFNAPLLEAMILLAEPGGTRPDRQNEQLFIISKHYLERSQGLLLLAREDESQRPLLLTQACTPYLEAPAHIRAYFADLTLEQKKALRSYQRLVRPMAQHAEARIGDMAHIPSGVFKPSAGQTVTLEAFAIAIYEITNAQYRQFIEAKGYTTREVSSEDGWAWVTSKGRRQPSYWDDEQLNAAEQPVVGVTWYEADAYCRWAGKALPTEFEWDKACRGDDGRRFPWGNTPLPPSTKEAGETPEQQQFTKPAAVGRSPQTQSPYGVHDMAGNALEWTHTARNGGQIVLCGGSGDYRAQDAGCGARHTLLPGISANFIGFRCLTRTP